MARKGKKKNNGQGQPPAAKSKEAPRQNKNQKKNVSNAPKDLTPTQQNIIRQKAIRNGSKVTPVDALVMAQGVKNTISVKVNFDLLSLQLSPVGRISMALVRGAQNPFSIYKIMFKDFTQLIKGFNGTAPSRLRYENDIYASVVPKSIPFRNDCQVQVSAADFDATPNNSIGIHGGKTYYMWETTSTGAWALQSAPPPTTDDQDIASYEDYQTKISGKSRHTQVVRDISLTEYYKRDASAFARTSTYYGAGGGVGGAYSSVEFETPFRSKFLGTFLEFSNTTPRASTKLYTSSGDSCSNWSIGALDDFKTSYYTGAKTPIYRFLDIAEAAFLLSETLVAAVSSYLQTNQVVNGNNSFLDVGLSFPYSVFLLMLRQQILYMFADSQCLGQFMSFETGTTAFQAFLCGSNVYPREPPTRMVVPSFFNENLKMLKMCIRPYETKQYANNRNHVFHIPVWGAYLEYGIPAFDYVNSQDIVTSLFAPEGSGPYPDLWDGTMGNDVVDINSSDRISEAIVEWNDWMISLQNVFSNTDSIGGDSNNAPLLQFTRYVTYNNNNETRQGTKEHTRNELVLSPGARVPHMYQRMVRTRKLERKTSKKLEEVIERFISIPDSTVFMEYTKGYSGMVPITPSHKEFLPFFIIPIIDLSSNDGLPSQSQVQISNQEGYSLFKTTDGLETFFASRAAEILAVMPDVVVGVAGRKTQISDFIDQLSKENQGAFLGDLFSTIGNVASTLGFGGVGTVASTLGGIGNAIGI